MQTLRASTLDRPYESLLKQIEDRHLHPEDHYEIAALLESMGWNDARVQAEFGHPSVFELARQLWSIQNQKLSFQANPFVDDEPTFSRITDALRQFFRGIIFAVPMGVSVASMLFLKFSLWSYQYLSVQLATSIAIGTILSFWTVGGFMQAIARRGFYYIYQGYYKLASQTTMRYIASGIITSIVVSALLFFGNLLFPVLPLDMIYVIILYYLVLNAIWLSVTAMYILKKESMFAGLITLGIGLVYVGFKLLHLNILVAQLASMTAISVVSIFIVVLLFRREERTKDKGLRPSLPRRGFTMYTVMPYFTYGFFYFVLLFIDRIMAWSTYSPFATYMIWFRGDYEVGLDFALLTLMIPMGVSEVVVSRLMNGSLIAQRQYYGAQAPQMNRVYALRYVRSLVLMGVVALISSMLIYIGVKWLMDSYIIGQNLEVLHTFNSNYVFIVGLISYAVLSLALLNAVTMFSLSRPDLVLRPLLLAIAVNLVIGFFFSRWINYTDAVWGLAAGSVVFTVLTTRNVIRVMRTFDYHLYLLS